MNMPKELETRFRKALTDIALDFVQECDAKEIQGCAAVIVSHAMQMCWYLGKSAGSTPEEFAHMAYKMAVSGPPDLQAIMKDS